MEFSRIEDVICFGSEEEASFGVVVLDFAELMPVGCLPLASLVFVRNEAGVDVFNWILEVIEQEIEV